MPDDSKLASRWEEIVAEAANESDSEKLAALAEQLFRVLDERERKIKQKAAGV